MSAPNMETIVVSLRSCSLEDKEVSSPAEEAPLVVVEDAEEEEKEEEEEEVKEVTVELNSEVALPYQWEQCLDMKTGEVYFINSADGTRNAEDSHLAGYYMNYAYYASDSSIGSDDTASDEEAEDCGIGSASRLYSSPVDVETDPMVLVVAGCRYCLMFIMVPKLDSACPKCGRDLLHLGRNGAGYF